MNYTSQIKDSASVLLHLAGWKKNEVPHLVSSDLSSRTRSYSYIPGN